METWSPKALFCPTNLVFATAFLFSWCLNHSWSVALYWGSPRSQALELQLTSAGWSGVFCLCRPLAWLMLFPPVAAPLFLISQFFSFLLGWTFFFFSWLPTMDFQFPKFGCYFHIQCKQWEYKPLGSASRVVLVITGQREGGITNHETLMLVVVYL